MRKIKIAIAMSFIVATVMALAGQAFGYPPFVVKARKFGAKDCTFCHTEPEGGPSWNDRGNWLIKEKERRGADAVDVDWLAEYKAKGKEKKPAVSGPKAEDKKPAEKMNAPAGASSVEKELLKLEREWLDAYMNRDAAAIERIEADDFMITHADGRTFTKADEIAGLKREPAPGAQSMSFSTEETKVRVYGDTAVLTGVVVMKSGDSLQRLRYTDVYVKRNGRWQVVASQLSNIGQPPAPPQSPSQPASPAQPAAPSSAAKVAPKVYDDYVGQYETPFGPLNITRDGDRLFGQPEGETKEELIPETDTVFNVPNVGAKVKFVRDANGKVTHMVLSISGQDVQAKKVK